MDPTQLSDHEADSVQAVVELHDEHHRQNSSLQRIINATTDRLGQPHVVIGLVLMLILWMALAAFASRGHFNTPTSAWLELCATLAALLIAMMILATQRRQDQLAERRAQLTLQLALLADKKMAKTIGLLEELRRDNPDLTDRVDAESDDMAKPTNPQEVLAAIDQRASSGSQRPESFATVEHGD